MIYKTDHLEKKLDKRRNKISFTITVFIYLAITLIFLLAGKFNFKKEETIIINVKLADKIYENQFAINKKSTDETIKKETGSAKKESSASDKKESAKESPVKKENFETDKNSNDEKKAVVEDNAIKEKDIIKEYEKAKADEKKKREEEFFSKKEPVKESKESSSLDKVLENIDADKSNEDGIAESKKNKNSDSAVLGENNIRWEGGRSRKLINKSNLTVPEEFKKEGLNTSLILKLTVIDSGLITKVTVQQTSGFNLLDYDMANQVKRWKFEEAIGAPEATAILPLNIIY